MDIVKYKPNGMIGLLNDAWDRLFDPYFDDAPSRTHGVPAIDLKETDDAYSLEACYGFHGFRVDRKELSTTLTDRPSEQIDYRDLATGVGTFVLSWRQKVAGGRIERVVLSAPYVTGDPTPENTGLPDRARAVSAVTALGRTLAESVTL